MTLGKKEYLKQFSYAFQVCALAVILIILASRESAFFRGFVTIPSVLSIIVFFHGALVAVTGIAIGWWGNVFDYQWLPYDILVNAFIKTENINTRNYTFYSGAKVRVIGFIAALPGLGYICYKIITNFSLL